MLTLDKAIEIAEIEEASDFQGITYDYEDAVRLLIEASKRFKRLREVIRVPYTDPLPGEDPQ